MVEKCCYNKKLMDFILFFVFLEEKLKTREDKRRQENGQTSIFFSILTFWAYTKKNQHIHFLVHGLSSWSTYGLHLVRGPKALQIVFN